MDICFGICMEKVGQSCQRKESKWKWRVLHLLAIPAQQSSLASPTNASDETDIIYYNEQSSIVRLLTKLNILIIGRDMNFQIGQDRNNKFYLQNTSNRIGEYLADVSIENRLICLNAEIAPKGWETRNLHLPKYI